MATEKVQLTTYVDDEWAERARAEAASRRWSVADYLRDLIERDLGPGGRVGRQEDRTPEGVAKKSAADPVHIKDGVGVLADPGFWPTWIRDSKRLEGEARDESFAEALRERKVVLPRNWSKMSGPAKLAWLRENDK